MLGPVVKGLGGVEKATELLIGLKAATWARGFATDLGLIGTAGVRTAAQVTADESAVAAEQVNTSCRLSGPMPSCLTSRALR